MRLSAILAVCIGTILAAGCTSTDPVVQPANRGGSRAESQAILPASRSIRPIEVFGVNGTPIEHPFLGGLNVPRPQFIDIDADGDPDLFLQEYTGSVMFFENVGDGRFMFRSDKYEGLDVGEWYRFADVDRDGDFDLLAEQPFSYIAYYRNDGSPEAPNFTAAADTLRDVDGKPIYSDRQNIPNLTDIDCDELSDLFIGKIDGTITRYEAVSLDADVPRFRFVTDRFEQIEIIAQFAQPGNANLPPVPNVPGGILPENGPAPPGVIEFDRQRHGANTMTFGDLDGDGDLDLYWGDFFEAGLLEIENTGSCRAPVLRSEPQPYPPPEPMVSSGYNAPAFADVDGDGDMDLLVGVLGGAFNPNRTTHANLYFYEQVAEDQFLLRTRRFLDQIDVGSDSIPIPYDLDGDGDVDLLLGNKISSKDSGTSVLFRYENVDGALHLRDSLALVPSYHYAPALADLDADGDPDMLLGTWNDGIHLYRNVGSATSPEFELEAEGFVMLTRGSNSTPALVDIDADGDLDLFVGETSGTLNYYRNDGGPERPAFTLVSDEYQGIEVDRRSAPMFADIDADGDYDLILGSEDEGLVLFRNSGTPSDPKFEREGSLPHNVPVMSTPALGDLDGDGRNELLVGGLGGGLYYYDD